MGKTPSTDEALQAVEEVQGVGGGGGDSPARVVMVRTPIEGGVGFNSMDLASFDEDLHAIDPTDLARMMDLPRG